MKNSLIKRLAAVLLALVLLVGCASALAETTAFERNLIGHFEQIDLSQKQLVLSVDPSLFGAEVSASFQQVNGIIDCQIQGPGFAAEAQTDGQTIWLSDGTNVYAVSVADIQHLIEDYLHTNAFYRFLTDDSYRMQLIMSLMTLYQKTLAQGITMSEDGRTININLTATQVLNGLADWMDNEVENGMMVDERTMHVASLLLNGINSVQPGSAPLTAEEALAQVKELVKQTAEQLRQTQVDFTITGTIAQNEDGSGITGNLVLTSNNQPVNLDFAIKTEYNGGSFTLSLYNEAMEALAINANWSTSGSETSFDAELKLPTENTTVSLWGTVTQNNIIAELKIERSSFEIFRANLTAIKSREGVKVILTANAGGSEVLYACANIGQNGGDLSIKAPNFSFEAALAEDELGRHPWSVSVTSGSSYYTQTYAFDWDGETFTVDTGMMKESFHGREISENEYALDVVIEYNSSYGWDPETATVLFKLTDGENGNWKLDVDAEQNEQATHGLTFEITDQSAIEPLADKVTQTLGEQDIVNMMFSLIMPSQSYSYVTDYYGY